jgi:PAS domain S-box-containing protein
MMKDFDQELRKLREITNKLTENGYLIDRAAQWEFAFDAVPDLVVIVNPQFIIKFVNKAFAKRLKTDKAKLVDEKSFSVVCDISDSGGNVCLAFNDSFGLIERSELHIGSLGGWFDFTRTPIIDEDGDLLGFVCILRDITEKIKTREALKVSENKYTELYNNSPDMHGSVDAKTALVKQCNDTLLRTLGYTREEVIGEEIFNLYHENCMEEVHEAFQTFVKFGDLDDIELQLKKKDGSSIDVSLNVSAIRDKDGNIKYSSSTWRDITEKKQLQKRYEEIFENTKNCVAVYRPVDGDQDFEIVDFNKTAEMQESVKREDIIGKKITDIFPDVEEFGLLDVFRRVHATGKPETHPLTFYDDGRTSGWKENYVYKLPENGGLIVTVYEDVTERIRANHAINKSAEMYRSLFENTGTATFVVEEDMTITQANTKSVELSGYLKEEIEGKMKTTDFVPVEGLEKIKEYHVGRREMDNDIPSEYEFEIINKNGEIKNVFIQAGLIPETKQSIASIIDITDRKLTEEALRVSEEKYRNVYKTAPLAFVVWDLKAHVVDWNIQAEELFGWSREEIIGNNFFNFIVPKKDRPHVKNIVDDLLKGTLANHSINDNVTKSGEIISCEWINSVLHDDEGNIIGAMSLGLDLSVDRVDRICKR